MKRRDAHAVFLGGGPGGAGPLFAAVKRGAAGALLDRGARWLDQGDAFGKGTIGDYRITSDTAASVLLECLPKDRSAPLGDVIDSEEKRTVEAHGSGPLALATAAQFLARTGESVRKLVERSPNSGVHTGFRIEEVHVEDEGFLVRGDERGERAEIRGRCLVWALGGKSRRDEALAASLPDGRTPAGLALRAVCTTEELFRRGIDGYREVLPSNRPARIAVLGGSHSAYATANMLLNQLGGENVRIEILCRRLPKLFYPTLEAAHAEGYMQATAADVCPVTKRVFRLAGLRLHARDVVRRVWGLGDVTPEKSVEIVHLSAREPSYAGNTMTEADLVVLALGYRPRTVPVYRRGERLPLATELGPRRPLVDGMCRVLLADGTPLPRAYGLGLASGFVPHGTMGGEPSFDGQTNGLWLYQNDVGARVLDQVLAER